MKKTGRYCSALAAAALLFAAGCVSYEDVKRKADAGDPSMQFEAAQMLLTGDGVPRNEAEAEAYLQKSMEAGNPAAAGCMAERIFRRKKGDESELLMKACEVVFSDKQILSFSEMSVVSVRRRNFPTDAIAYTRYLNDAGFWKSSMKFRKFAMPYLTREKCFLPGRLIVGYRKKLEGMKSQQEIKEEQRIAEEKRKAEERIAEEKRKAEAAKWNDPAVKFPKRSISGGSSIPLFGDLLSGTSYQWIRHFKENPKKPFEPDRLNSSVSFYGFYVQEGDNALIFAMEEPFSKGNKDQAVFVQREFQLGRNIAPETAIRKILKEHPDAKREIKKNVTRKQQNIEQKIIQTVEITTYVETLRTKDKEWQFTYARVSAQAKFTAWGNRVLSASEKAAVQNECPQNELQGPVVVLISDRKLVKAFRDIRTKDVRRREAAEKKARQEKADRELKALSL